MSDPKALADRENEPETDEAIAKTEAFLRDDLPRGDECVLGTAHVLRVLARLRKAEAELATARETIARQAKIIDTLPKDANGTPITNGCIVTLPHGGGDDWQVRGIVPDEHGFESDWCASLYGNGGSFARVWLGELRVVAGPALAAANGEG